jgi:NUMOD3 motif.
MSDKVYCVYTHSRQSDGKIFYVGKGKKNRPYFFKGRSSLWSRITAKHGCVVSIYASGLSENDAFDLEKKLISEIGRNNLCNHTDGGDGCSNPSPETRRKMSLAKIGHVKSPEAIQKHAEKLRGKKMPPEAIEKTRLAHLGSKRSDESRRKMSEAAKNKPKCSEEARRKMSASRKGKKQSPELIAKRFAKYWGEPK